ncbi:competence protein ComEA [Pseudomonas sp. S25]|uniref:Competence protein ComEA n=1 Tax=Pseudomonas maioricensis TaxID=1766623 RepID=A0ABS9ZIJ6_9PSED|nr:helix-hairpin-helix domain-containing protein [Pseudomonas sp. S25]MCI8210405.1 competence protein ComEA [Pseudomonas sp. S25]
MRKAFLSSLLFAVLTSVSVVATAAPTAPLEKTAPVMQEQMAAKVNINTADAETLQKQLSGIGKGKAEAIVAYREANGEFTSVDELIEVKGIGKALLDKNQDKIAVE